MDRLDAMKVFVVAVDEGSLAAAGRKLGRSPAAVSRAIAFLEERAGSKLLYRTTRSIKLSEEGERYVASCRSVLATYRHRRFQSDCATASNLSDPDARGQRVM